MNPVILEDLRRRKEQRDLEDEDSRRPRLYLPLPEPREQVEESPEEERGVCIIQII